MAASSIPFYKSEISEFQRECMELAGRVLGSPQQVRLHEHSNGYYSVSLVFFGGTTAVLTPETDSKDGAWEDGRDFLRDMEKRFLAAQSGSLNAEYEQRLTSLRKALLDVPRSNAGPEPHERGSWVRYAHIEELVRKA